MSINGDYTTPVTVNGYICKNCTDVDYAKKHIDPQHPRSGPYGITAKDDPTANCQAAVTFGGGLSGLDTAGSEGSSQPSASTSGTQLDISA